MFSISSASPAYADSASLFPAFYRRPGKLQSEAKLSGLYQASSDVEDQEATFKILGGGLEGDWTLKQSDSFALSAHTQWEVYDIRTQGKLPPQKARNFPSILHEANVGLSFLASHGKGHDRERFGGGFELGYATDQWTPLLRSATLNLHGFTRLKTGAKKQGSLLIGAHFSNNRGYLDWFPLPSLAYEFRTSKVFALLGYPLFALIYRPSARIQLQTIAIPASRVEASLRIQAVKGESFRVGWLWEQTPILRTFRSELRERFFLDESKIFLTVISDLGPYFEIEFFAGVSLLRRAFEARHAWAGIRGEATHLSPTLFGNVTLTAHF